MEKISRRALREDRLAISDDTGYSMEMDKISFNDIDLKWASYVNPQKKVLSFQPEKPAIVSHFRLVDAGDPGIARRSLAKMSEINENQFVVYRESPQPYDLHISPTHEKPRSFFELYLSDELFEQICTEESEFLARFRSSSFNRMPAFDFVGSMSPAMQGIIHEIMSAPYQGHLKGIYLEAKSIELFLLQVHQFDRPTGKTTLKPADIERLHAVKAHIDLHYHQPCSITALARMAGLNQMKLKNGFRELFHTTVFGYLNERRMQEAKRLLLDEKLYVGEVADRMGYAHAHHFTAAFKRKFGVLPGSLKNS